MHFLDDSAYISVIAWYWSAFHTTLVKCFGKVNYYLQKPIKFGWSWPPGPVEIAT